MRKLSVLIPIIILSVCSCRKINLYPVFEEPEQTVFLVDMDNEFADSLSFMAASHKFTADSLYNAGDTIKAFSHYKIADSLYEAAHAVKRPINLIPADSCNVFVHFIYARNTRSFLDRYDCHAFKGRAKCGETILSECTFDRYMFLGLSGKDSLDYKYIPFIFPIPVPRETYYLEFKIPANNSTSSRTIDFEYSYQLNTFFNKWTDWSHISSIKQDGLN